MSDRGLLQRIRNPPQPPTNILAPSKVLICIMPIVQIAMGAVYLDDCPKQRYIPIYLVVMGVFSILLAVLACLPCAQEQKEGDSSPLNLICTSWNSLASLFVVCWFIAGNVWIYSIYEPNYNKTMSHVEPYCNKTVYLFAFWTTTLIYVLLGLFLFIGCCVMACLYMCSKSSIDENI